MQLSDYRQQIDDIDAEILSLFVRRMECAAAIGLYKKEHALPLTDRARERDIIDAVRGRLPAELKDYGASLFSLLTELSKAHQRRISAMDGGTGG